MADEFQINGLSETLRKLRELPVKLQKKGLRTAVRKGANIVRKAAIANAKALNDPNSPEDISKNIAVQFASRLSKREGGIAYRVGVLGGARKTAGSKLNPGGETFHFRFLEFGTSRQAARPFLLPALTQNIDAATNAIVATLNTEIDKLAK